MQIYSSTKSIYFALRITIGALYGGLCGALGDGPYGGLVVWALFGVIVAIIGSINGQRHNQPIENGVVGVVIGMMIVSLAHWNGDTDPQLMLVGTFIWGTVGGCFGYIGRYLSHLVASRIGAYLKLIWHKDVKS